MVADFSATPYFNYLFYQVLDIALSAVVLLFTVIVTIAIWGMTLFSWRDGDYKAGDNNFDDFRYVIDKAMADTPVMLPYDEIYGCTMSDSVSDNLAQCLLVFDNGGELMDQFKDEIDTTLGAIYKEFDVNPTWYEYREDSTSNFSKYYTASTLSISGIGKRLILLQPVRT